MENSVKNKDVKIKEEENNESNQVFKLEKKKKKKVKDDKYGNYGYLFLAPFFIALSIFVIYPQIYSIVLSFTRWEGGSFPVTFIGFDNYKRLLLEPTNGALINPIENPFLKSVGNTILLWVMNFIPQLTIALALAVILTARKIPGAQVFRAVYYFPNLVTMAAVGVIFFFIMDWQNGSLNAVLTDMNILKEKYNWLLNEWTARGSKAFTLFWMWFGYTMIIFMAGIKGIPDVLYEAAYVDGANKWQAFKSITLPLLKPIMLYNVVTSVIGGMTNFDIPFIITRGIGAPDGALLTSVMYMFNTAWRYNDFGFASTIAVGLFIIIAIFVTMAFKLINRNPSSTATE